MAKDIVNVRFALHVDRRTERDSDSANEFRVAGRERWRRLARDTAVAEQETQRVRIHRNLAPWEVHGGAEQRKLVSMDMRCPQRSNHLLGLKDTVTAVTPLVG